VRRLQSAWPCSCRAKSPIRWSSNSPQMNAPEAYIQFTPGLITDEGEVTVASTEQFLRNYMAEFQMFIGRVFSVLPRQT
jgi:chromate reductase, NAD(P)H dehydrogenase (quinone)